MNVYEELFQLKNFELEKSTSSALVSETLSLALNLIRKTKVFISINCDMTHLDMNEVSSIINIFAASCFGLRQKFKMNHCFCFGEGNFASFTTGGEDYAHKFQFYLSTDSGASSLL